MPTKSEPLAVMVSAMNSINRYWHNNKESIQSVPYDFAALYAIFVVIEFYYGHI